MKNKMEFDGMAIDVNNVQDVEENFEEWYGDEVIYISKEEYTHEEEDLNFKYKYIIEVLDMEYLTGESGVKDIVLLHLVVSPEFITKDIYNDILYTIGMEEEENYELSYLDVKEHGLSVTMADEELEDKSEELLKNKVNTIASLTKSIDGMRGFYLDKPWNAIGSNGWSTVEHMINGEDLFSF